MLSNAIYIVGFVIWAIIFIYTLRKLITDFRLKKYLNSMASFVVVIVFITSFFITKKFYTLSKSINVQGQPKSSRDDDGRPYIIRMDKSGRVGIPRNIKDKFYGRRATSMRLFSEDQINAIRMWEKDTNKIIEARGLKQFLDYFRESYFFANAKQKKTELKTVVLIIPDSMSLNEDTVVTLYISKCLMMDSVTLPGSTVYKHEKYRLSEKIKATLDCPENEKFEIRIMGTDEQIVDDSTKTQWVWSIEPIDYGQSKLLVSYRSKFGEEKYKDTYTYHKVYIRSSFFQRVKYNFKQNQPLYMMISAVIPLSAVAGFLRWLKTKKRKAKKNEYWQSNNS